VLVEEVDGVHPQALQRLIGDLPDALRATVEPVSGHAIPEAELGRDHHLAAERLECLTHNLFVDAGAVGLRSVVEGDAPLVSCADELDRLAVIRRRAIAVAEAHAAEPNGRNFKIAVAQPAVLHVVLLGSSNRYEAVHRLLEPFSPEAAG
jgi:hypothetical protein